jgi:hypothetical protein
MVGEVDSKEIASCMRSSSRTWPEQSGVHPRLVTGPCLCSSCVPSMRGGQKREILQDLLYHLPDTSLRCQCLCLSQKENQGKTGHFKLRTKLECKHYKSRYKGRRTGSSDTALRIRIDSAGLLQADEFNWGRGVSNSFDVQVH